MRYKETKIEDGITIHTWTDSEEDRAEFLKNTPPEQIVTAKELIDFLKINFPNMPINKDGSVTLHTRMLTNEEMEELSEEEKKYKNNKL